MQALDVVRLATTIAAVAASVSKILPATLPFWEKFSPPLSRWLPGIVLVLGALPAALTGVTTWEQFGLAVLGAITIAMPGTHKNLASPIREPERQVTINPPPPRPPSVPPMVAMLCLLIGLVSCAGDKPKPCSAGDTVVASKLAECKLRQAQECKDVPAAECPVSTECKAWIRSYCAGVE